MDCSVPGGQCPPPIQKCPLAEMLSAAAVIKEIRVWVTRCIFIFEAIENEYKAYQ
jgi:hypothetical protein